MSVNLPSRYSIKIAYTMTEQIWISSYMFRTHHQTEREILLARVQDSLCLVNMDISPPGFSSLFHFGRTIYLDNHQLVCNEKQHRLKTCSSRIRRRWPRIPHVLVEKQRKTALFARILDRWRTGRAQLLVSCLKCLKKTFLNSLATVNV